jgi:hypothetical protein
MNPKKRSDSELGVEVVRLKDERRRVARELNALVFRDDVENRIGSLVASARARFEALVANVAGAPNVIPGEIPSVSSPFDAIVFASVVASADFEQRLREAVEALPDNLFAEGSRDKAEAELTRLDGKLAAIELELERRKRERAVAEAERELSAL